MKNLQINIFTNELVWMGLVDNVKSLVHRSSWHEIVNSELTVSKTSQGVQEIQIGRILVVNNQREKALIVEDLRATLNDEYITFTCIPLKGMLNYRIVHPLDSGASGSWVAKKQSQVMMWMASDNLITQTRDLDRKFWNLARTKNMFQISTVKSYGNTIDYTVDWETGYMGDAITSIAKNSTRPLGWNIYITENFSAFELDVYQATEKHINQSILPPVVFSEEFGNISNASYEYSIKEWRNVVYMIWSALNSTVINNTPIGNTNKGATFSFNRKELIYNSTKKTTTEITSDGSSELNKRPHVESFTAEILNNEKTMTTYRTNWNVGDVVTVQSSKVIRDKKISIDAQIIEIEEIYESGEYTINATFGIGKLTLLKLIKQSIEQKK